MTKSSLCHAAKFSGRWAVAALTRIHLVLVAAFALASSSRAVAQAPGRLLLSNDSCLINPCPPHPPLPTTVAAGAPFQIYVLSVTGSGAQNTTYAGTVSFSSTDPIANLPAAYMFQPGDKGVKAFTAVLFTVGLQTITVSDPGNGLTSGTLTMTVSAAAAAPIPVTSNIAKLLLALLLGTIGFWLTCSRR